jgi:hypothetical protein
MKSNLLFLSLFFLAFILPIRAADPVAIIGVEGKQITDGSITVELNEEVLFQGEESTDPDMDFLTYTWDFGDGQISNKRNPSYAFTQPGTYFVTLTVEDTWPQYEQNPHVIDIDSRHVVSGRGAIIVHDLNDDGLLDFILSSKENDFESGRATLSAIDHNGEQLWIKDNIDFYIEGNAENYGLPGWSGPGTAAGDVDNDGNAEVLHLNGSGQVVIRNGQDGEVERTVTVPKYSGAPSDFQWTHLQIANLRGQGDFDLILQGDRGSNESEYTPFPHLTGINIATGEVLWNYDNYSGCKHNGFRACDLDMDGRDEVGGATIIDDNGTLMNSWDYKAFRDNTYHFDSQFMYDVRPDIPGIEVVLLEEGHVSDDHTSVVSYNQFIWTEMHNTGWEPQNAAVGNFDPTRAGLEIWNRSRTDDQTPWVYDAQGNEIASYNLFEYQPSSWTGAGVEQIYAIDWEGGNKEYAAAKERHVDAGVCIYDAMGGSNMFIEYWGNADELNRVYVVDISGDYREELVAVSMANKKLYVYWNEQENSNQPRPRKWLQNCYRRQKQNYNYYSP